MAVFETVDLQGKVGNQLFQIVVLPLEVFNLLTCGVSYRISGETLFARFHEFLGPGIEDTRLDPLPSAEVTDRDLPSEPFQDYADLVFRGVLPAGLGPDLPDEKSWSLGSGSLLLGLDRCGLGTLMAPL
jgi:hypothetical protein